MEDSGNFTTYVGRSVPLLVIRNKLVVYAYNCVVVVETVVATNAIVDYQSVLGGFGRHPGNIFRASIYLVHHVTLITINGILFCDSMSGGPQLSRKRVRNDPSFHLGISDNNQFIFVISKYLSVVESGKRVLQHKTRVSFGSLPVKYFAYLRDHQVFQSFHLCIMKYVPKHNNSWIQVDFLFF